MAKAKYEYWLTDDGLTLLRGWARDGLTDMQMAHNMGISRKTLAEWKVKYSCIGDTLKQSKEIADYIVENALYNEAVKGNTTAIIFWLKNRRPKAWREKVDIGITEIKDDAADELEKHFAKRKPSADCGVLPE
jgi:DNA-binding XRE family transcriptional regulator